MTGGLLVVGGTALLGGCGGDAGSATGAPAPVAAGSASPATASAVPVNDPQRLNVVLNLLYVSAQFHGHAATGAGLPATLLAGVGAAGAVTGARAAALADPLVVAAAAELASDKQAQVAALRSQLGTAAAAMPAIDLAGGAGGAFGRVARTIGATALDPYADDAAYLIGALSIDYAAAAIQRGLLARMEGAAGSTAMSDVLAGSIHQGGLLRALLDARSPGDPTMAARVGALNAAFATLDGSGGADTSLVGGGSAGTNLPDGAGRPIPFTRDVVQAWRLAFLDAQGNVGGFLPGGMNGIA